MGEHRQAPRFFTTDGKTMLGCAIERSALDYDLIEVKIHDHRLGA